MPTYLSVRVGRGAGSSVSCSLCMYPHFSSRSLPPQSVVSSMQELTVPIQSTGTGSFGFQIMGGHETDMPATVEFVVPGGRGST